MDATAKEKAMELAVNVLIKAAETKEVASFIDSFYELPSPRIAFACADALKRFREKEIDRDELTRILDERKIASFVLFACDHGSNRSDIFEAVIEEWLTAVGAGDIDRNELLQA